MAKKRYQQLDIVQDPDARPRRKRKRKVRPVYIPWRWVLLSFAGGVIAVALAVLVLTIGPAPNHIDTAPAPVSTITGEGEYLRGLTWAGQRLAAAGSNSLRVYDDVLNTSQAHWMADYGESINLVFNKIAFSPHGSQVAGIATLTEAGRAVSRIAVWDTSSGNLMRAFTAHEGGSPDYLYNGGLDRIIFSPDEHYMITGAGDGQLLMWDSITGEQAASLSTGATATLAIGFQLDPRKLVVVNRYGQEAVGLQIWDIVTRVKEYEAPIDHPIIFQVALDRWSAHLAIQAGNSDRTFIGLWEVTGGKLIGTIPIETYFIVDELAISDHWLALSGRWPARTDPTSGETSEAYSELRVLHWDVEADGAFQYEVSAAKADYVSRADIQHLHFDVDQEGTTWLSYVSGAASSDLQRWSLDTGQTGVIRFW